MKKLLTPTKEDYIRAIFLFTGEVGIVELSRRLGLSKSTVSERVADLVKDGLVEREPYGKLSLTTKGKRVGKNLTFKHRVIESFLHDLLNIPKEKVHEEAHKLEHAVSDDVLKRLYNVLGRPDTDPHGTPISKI